MARRVLTGVLVAAAIGVSSTAHAVIALDFTGGLQRNFVQGSNTPGWRFTVNNAINVTSLGVFDNNPAAGNSLTNSHQVAIWACSDATCTAGASGNLPTNAIIQGTVPTGNVGVSVVASGSGLGDWVFAPVGAMVLTPGDYAIGAFYVQNDTDLMRRQATATTAAQISGVTPRINSFGTPYSFPTILSPGNADAFFGPNFDFSRVVSNPEPGVMASLVGFAVLAAGGWARRRRRS